MDTTKLEMQAESHVSSLLSKYDFHVSKPQYDKHGGDLHILDDPLSPTRLLRVQSKGRSFDRPTNIKIPKSYVGEHFVLILYLIDEQKDEHLYIFFPEEIIAVFTTQNDTYNLSCSKATFQKEFANYSFTKEKVEELKRRLFAAKIKEETTLLIDSFCLENSIKATIETYNSIYPTKRLAPPTLLNVIKQVLNSYDKNRLENRIINVYLFLTPHNWIQTDFYSTEDLYINKSKIRIFEMRIDGLVSFEIEDFLKRIINSENILLLASDIKYVPLLQELQKEEKDIVLVCEKLDNAIKNYGFNWGDVVYPIAFAMGLTTAEI
jgi:hypothetical protein